MAVTVAAVAVVAVVASVDGATTTTGKKGGGGGSGGLSLSLLQDHYDCTITLMNWLILLLFLCAAMPAAVSAGDVIANVSGANIALTCVFRGITLPTVAWTKMGGGAVGGTTNTVGLTTPYQVRSTLTFTTLAKANEGRYTCTATNSNGTASQQVQLTVQGTVVQT